VSQGVVFRARDDAHYYALLLDSRGRRYTVRKQDGPEGVTEIIPWKDSPLVKGGQEHNLIRVDAEGDAFTIYLNGQPADTFTDGSFRSGMLGLIVANGDAQNPHMHFDALTIWSADPAPPEPDLPETRDALSGEMALIPGGEFIMGDNEQPDAPPHVVDVPSFYIDTTEVTNNQYADCVEDGACTVQIVPSSETHPTYATQDEYDDYPVIHITWQQANQFCQWAGKRLPTEAEWEKAASWSAEEGKAIWAFGDVFDAELLNSDESGNNDTTEVDSFEAELNGTYDMAGNVSEWTSTLFQPYPYSPDAAREDQAASGERVYRGGSWGQTRGKARSALRQFAPATYDSREIGLRCAANP
jgi:formylglycine-generating enzyme required for sulfatase activity